jgi:hypothetical protein
MSAVDQWRGRQPGQPGQPPIGRASEGGWLASRYAEPAQSLCRLG